MNKGKNNCIELNAKDIKEAVGMWMANKYPGSHVIPSEVAFLYHGNHADSITAVVSGVTEREG